MDIEKKRYEAVIKSASTNDQCLFTVVIPTHNRPALLRRALRSVRSQNFSGLEVIVINDGSTDEYNLGEDECRGVRYLRNDHAGGVSYARNQAIERASGEWIVFLDDDDVLADRYLKTLEKYIVRSPDVGLLWSDVEIRSVGKDGEVESLKRVWPRAYVDDEHLKSTALSIGASFGLAIKKEFFLRYGGFDLSFSVCEDVELIARLLSKDIKVQPVSRVGVVKYEDHSDRLSGNLAIYSETGVYERLIGKHKDFFKNNPACTKHMLRWALQVHGQSKNVKGEINAIKNLWVIGDKMHCIKYTISASFLRVLGLPKYARF
ncbi:glycosyltransferase family 2 protein [Teredinibacter purpureus]|uniref:glycosyltransferase family 2 protein n=1 Tax=Teredinibacter purpureus TaxID=2731756 RepID=UPI0005F81B04|nr:glycosyltransferase [Teredinibacter purpureus]